MEKAGLRSVIMIDSSHSNSSKDYRRQPEVLADIGQQISRGDQRIMGVMIESHLVAGRQDLVDGQALTYGQSITDGCIDRKSTRLNSSHVAISYAVFCLKKKIKVTRRCTSYDTQSRHDDTARLVLHVGV